MNRGILSEGGREAADLCSLLAERAPREGPRSTRAVERRPAASLKRCREGAVCTNLQPLGICLIE